MTDLVLSARGDFKREHFTRRDGNRALAMVNDTVLAFLDRHARGDSEASLRAAIRRDPELEPLDTRSLREYAGEYGEGEVCPVQTAG